MCFLSSAPSYGQGAVPHASLNDIHSSSEFYSDLGAKAAKIGSRIDLIGVGRSQMGFPQLRGLAQATGGSILLYPDTQRCSLPQDL
jgi:hypothetical protein